MKPNRNECCAQNQGKNDALSRHRISDSEMKVLKIGAITSGYCLVSIDRKHFWGHIKWQHIKLRQDQLVEFYPFVTYPLEGRKRLWKWWNHTLRGIAHAENTIWRFVLRCLWLEYEIFWLQSHCILDCCLQSVFHIGGEVHHGDEYSDRTCTKLALLQTSHTIIFLKSSFAHNCNFI